MAQLRSVNTKFWDDTWVEELKPNEKLLFLYLITNKYANLLGVYSISEKRICFETGLDKASVSNGLKAFETVGKVKRLADDYIYLPKWLKNQRLNANMKTGVYKIFKELPNDVKISMLGNDYQMVSNDYQTLSNTMLKYEVEDEREDEDECDAYAKTDKIDFHKLGKFFNETCNGLPVIKSITATRKGAVNARLKEYSKDDITEVIKLASTSKFLNGENDKGWRANFDWIFNPTNFAKIIEGNYSEQTESERHNLNLPEGIRIATKLDIEDCIGGYDAKKAIQSGKQYVYDKGVLLVQKDKEGNFYRNREGKNIRL